MIESGTVLEWRDGKARIRLDGALKGECPRCAMSSHCVGGKADGVIEIASEEELAPGRRVNVHMNLPSAAKAAGILFLLPLAGLLAGFFIGQAIGESVVGPEKGEGAGIIGALILVVLTFFSIGFIERRRARRNPPIRIEPL